MKLKAQLMDSTTMGRALMRISHEIVEKNKGVENLCLVGIHRRGKPMAEIICGNIEKIEGVRIPCSDIDINFYRDDLTTAAESPVVKKAELPFNIVGKTVIIVDDVLYTGRTARAAIEALFSIGRPGSIQLAILIDRGHRELPIRADYVGKSIPTSKKEAVRVMLPPYEEEMGVELYEIDI